MNKESILSIVRHLLTFGGGFMTSANIATGDEVSVLISSIIAIAGVIWGIVEKMTRPKLNS